METTAVIDEKLSINLPPIYEMLSNFSVPYMQQDMVPFMIPTNAGKIGLRQYGNQVKVCPGAKITAALTSRSPLLLRLTDSEGTKIYNACFSPGLVVELLPSHLDAKKNIMVGSTTYRPKVLVALMIKMAAIKVDKNGYFEPISVKDSELWIDPSFNSPTYQQTRIKRVVNKEFIKPLMTKGVPAILKEHIWETIFTAKNTSENHLNVGFVKITNEIVSRFEKIKVESRAQTFAAKKEHIYYEQLDTVTLSEPESYLEIPIITPV